MKHLSILLAMAGLALGTLIVAWYGAGHVAAAALSVGWNGFSVLLLGQLALYVVLATAWVAACPEIPWTDLLLGRAVREAATGILPFAHLGGIAAGIQAVRSGGTRLARAFAATVVDVTFESIAQCVFIAAGVAALAWRAQDSRLAWPLALGIAVMAASLGGFVWLQRDGDALVRRVVTGLGQRVARQWRSAALDGAGQVHDEFDRVYAHPRRAAAAASLHLAAWIGGAAWSWAAYRLLGADVTPLEALAIEGVVSGVLTLSFVVPGNLGVQEAAYIALGSLFGVGADLSLGLSLLRRAKDLALGVPALLLWQAVELRRARRAVVQAEHAE